MADLASQETNKEPERIAAKLNEEQSTLPSQVSRTAASGLHETPHSFRQETTTANKSWSKRFSGGRLKRYALVLGLTLLAVAALAALFLSSVKRRESRSPQESPTVTPNSASASTSPPGEIDWAATLDNLEKESNIGQNIFTVIALTIGGIWTYFTFVKGRVLTPHLEPRLSLKTFKSGEHKYLVATIQLKNTGASKVDLVQKGTLLGVFSYRPGTAEPKAEDIKWERYKASAILKDHHWIEPGEAIEEPVLIALPASELAIYKVLLRINSKKTSWTVEAIIEGKIENKT